MTPAPHPLHGRAQWGSRRFCREYQTCSLFRHYRLEPHPGPRQGGHHAQTFDLPQHWSGSRGARSGGAPCACAGARPPAPPPAAAAIDHAEHARTIEVMRPPKRARPVIALLTLNEATEVTDFLVPYGVLQRANVADVTVVAERAAPVPLHPFNRLGRGPALLRIEPQSTLRFRRALSDGADYVVVPLWSRATIRSSWSGSSPNTARVPGWWRSARAP